MHSEIPLEDTERLINTILPFCQQMVQRHGGFHPFGAVMSTVGDVELVAAYAGEEFPDPDDLERMLRDGMREGIRDGKYRAVAICADVHLTREDGAETDAIRIHIEHEEGNTSAYYIPYRLGEGDPEYGDIFRTTAERRIFPI
ncbi:MAG: hypothetical protein KatS3mg015_1058 [Fimbriimonadales bacterium]|nr:MAG: hypothetical protein KatS3mg015_1058 [Fimbriimonadales bacterium]